MRNRLAYWMHQLVEYLLGLVLLSEAARMKRPVWVALCGVAVVLAAALGDAPLSAFRGVSRRVHRAVDVALGAVVVAVGVALVDGAGRVVTVVIGLLLLALAVVTDFRPKVVKPPLRERLPDPHTAGRIAGRWAGKAAVAGRSRWRARR
jgi:hypothetical protein